MNRPITWWVDEQVRLGKWREVMLGTELTGLDCPINVFEAERASPFIKPWRMSADERSAVFCPSLWNDLAIGSGPCGLQCRACFLVLTHRIRRDPHRHLIYTNYKDMRQEVERWLKHCRSFESLGLGIDCSDSLLYDRYTGISEWLFPMFASATTNPSRTKLILLTKTANVAHLKNLPKANIVISFSLNPEQVASSWEGIAPPIEKRVHAARMIHEWGFEERWRIDPILTIDGWQDHYRDFFFRSAQEGSRPNAITLGMYRQKSSLLDYWCRKWELAAMDWQPTGLFNQGTHDLLPESVREDVYRLILKLVHDAFGSEINVGLCKETHTLRRKLQLSGTRCNCMK